MNDLLHDTIEITQAAGAAIMSYYRSSFDVTNKSPDNPVTDADFAADNLLKERLLARLPQAGWLSEETVDNPQRFDHDQIWIVDPLDGTKEFVMGIPEFAVSVALVDHGEPILGVIFNPAADELFYAARGQGVFFNGQKVSVTHRTTLAGATIDGSRSEIKRGEFKPFDDLLNVRIMGSIAYKLARVAAGQTDATWSRGPKNEWDICAGVMMLLENNGRSVNLDNQPFTFNRPGGPLVNGIIADNGHLHDEIIATLAPYRDNART
ncbi:MAG TPA: 3'(2'),5'-bisphosphate nucleotidase CysQ [Anaerolineae bacterium]|nr:3'(2'),5'-bisphosphate nucleotidase CysQ [Anaerolineae bacterium]